ncbi:hypothetical protein JS533_011320 [Bifidobacterium amazonense]|uniref:Transposase n=1 Tax=Bifidobacterium amazonense TaxID=2809027 RepID=A0ABS9VXK8_9BIFI|nr:hypothetical protein [Bifidobacterium amazonense]MCH9276854.1 hypothetical protein [Bifidobacterium amazonense]
MVRRIKAELVLRLREQGLSRNAIAMGYGMSKHSVIDVFDAADRLGVSYGDVETKSDDEVYGGGGTHADVIMDRIVHSTTWIETGDWNMRTRARGK